MIKQITQNKKDFLELLLLADEQESMIERYLDRGEMFVLYKDELPYALCVVTDEGGGVLELKNIATAPEHQRRGYGRRLIQHIESLYTNKFSLLTVGTGESPQTIDFYEHCGFTKSHRVKNFFTDNYDHPIYEDGVQLVDMVYLSKKL